MNFIYETKRLKLEILDSSYHREVLDFYYRNRALFEPNEPSKPENYYTEGYMEKTMEYEHRLALKLSLIRYWVWLKENQVDDGRAVKDGCADANPGTDEGTRLIGTVAISDVKRGAQSCCQIGYRFDKDHLRRGYATEALECLIPEIWRSLGMHRIEATALPQNTPSIKLLEKLGFEFEGVAKSSVCICGRWEDHLRYALINPGKGS